MGLTFSRGGSSVKSHILLLIFASTVSLFAYPQAVDNPSGAQGAPQVEKEIADVIQQRLHALRQGDARSYATFFAEDCISTSDSGALVKAADISGEWLQDQHSGITYTGSAPKELRVHSYGDIAVANFRLDLDEDWSGQKLFGSSRLTDVFARRNGRWLLVAHHEVPIPNARRLAVKVDPNSYDAYAGEYQLTPTYIVNVKRDGDRLMDQWPGDPAYVEDVPVSESTFVARGEPGEVIYGKDQAGKVTHFILRTQAGDLIAKKIK
jgi:ketosteroid isomerase-like protein